MADTPVLGKNVKRFDRKYPTVWNNFFNNAAKVFNVPTEKVMPFDAAISYGDKSNMLDQGINTFDENNLGATYPAGDFRPEGQIAVSSSANFFDRRNNNAAEHEYMHNIDTHFADHQTNMYGKSPSREYQVGLLNAASQELGPVSPSYEKYEEYNYKKDKDGNITYVPAGPLERYLAAPDVYENELAKSITGYGGRDGDYEYQMMKDSWEKRGPMNSIRSHLSENDRAALSQELELQTEGMTPASKQAYITREMSKHIYKHPDHAQQRALEDAFNNNPRNNRLGDAKELIAPMVAQALSDNYYDKKVNQRYLAPEGAGVYATDEDGNTYETAMRPAYITQSGGGPLDARRGIPLVQTRNEPAAYLDSVSERFARLGAQYMKEDRSYAGGGNDFYNYEFSTQRPDKDLTLVKDDFRKGMNILLNK